MTTVNSSSSANTPESTPTKQKASRSSSRNSKRNQVSDLKRAIRRNFDQINDTMCSIVEFYAQLRHDLQELNVLVGPKGIKQYADDEMPHGLTVLGHLNELLYALMPIVDAKGKSRMIVPRIRVIENNLHLQLTHDGVKPIKAVPIPGFVIPNITEDIVFGLSPGGFDVIKESQMTVHDLVLHLCQSQARPVQDDDEEFQRIKKEIWAAGMAVATYVEEYNNREIRALKEELKKTQQANKRYSTILKNKGALLAWILKHGFNDDQEDDDD